VANAKLTAAHRRKTDHLWRDALMLALHREESPGSKRTMLAAIADACVTAAVAGDMQAIKEIGNRMDGMPKQQLDVEPGEAMTSLVVRWATETLRAGGDHDSVQAEAAIPAPARPN